MAPLVLSLAQSESKARFFERLGLDQTDRTHKRVYALMKLEAAGARKRLLESQDRSTAQIHEAAWQREVLRMYDEASIETKAVYRFGHDTENRTEPDNWIIRWLLWHVFRYRDHRNYKNRDYTNKGRASTTPAMSNTSSSYGDDDNDEDGDDDEAAEGTAATAAHDDVQERESSVQSSTPGESSAHSGDGGPGHGSVRASSSSSQYWDPIRERWQS